MWKKVLIWFPISFYLFISIIVNNASNNKLNMTYTLLIKYKIFINCVEVNIQIIFSLKRVSNLLKTNIILLCLQNQLEVGCTSFLWELQAGNIVLNLIHSSRCFLTNSLASATSDCFSWLMAGELVSVCRSRCSCSTSHWLLTAW